MKPAPPPVVAAQVQCLGIAQLKDGACALVQITVSPEPSTQGRRQRVAAQRILFASAQRASVERQFREEAFVTMLRRGEPRVIPSPYKDVDIEHVEAVGIHKGPGSPKLPWLVLRVETKGQEVTLLESVAAHATRLDACTELDREAGMRLLTDERRQYSWGRE